MKISILGGGSWGTALAIHLAVNNHKVKVWEFFEHQAKKMQEERFCPLLPQKQLHDNIFVSHKMEESLADSELILIVVPSDKVKITVQQAKLYINNQPILVCSKGFSEDLELMSELLNKELDNETFFLYGPTHAEEVCHGLFSGIVLAGKNNETREKIKQALINENFKVDTTEDIIGVQIASALKNIIAIFAGLLDGLEQGDNSKAYVITKGLEEIKNLGVKLGAKEETFYGLAGIGDIIVTSMSKHSRNRFVGEQLGKGRKLNEIVEEMNMVAEGVNTIKSAIKLAERENINLPLIKSLSDVLFNGKDPKEVLNF